MTPHAILSKHVGPARGALALSAMLLIPTSLVACGPTRVPASSTPSAVAPLPTLVATARRGPATPTATITARICPSLSDVPPPQRPEDDQQLGQAVLAYLQAGGDPERIAQLAAEWGAVEQVPTYLSAISSDLNNDGMDELALAGTIEPLNSPTIWIYQCGFADYFLAATFPIAGGPLMWIGFLRTEERTPTDFPFLILGYAAWGQSNVFAVVGWDSRAWRLFIQQVTTRGNIAVYGDGKHGRAYVDFLEATTASMAGGPPRGLLTSYVWDRDTYVPLPTFYAPSSQRIHLLEDAQRALDEGLLGQAVAIYDVAATDDMYFSAPSQYEVDAGLEEQAEAYQTAFALFRYAAIWAALGDESYAGTIATNMARSYPARAPGSEFGDGLRLFLDRLHEGESNSAACRAVDSSLGSTYPHLSGDDGHVGYWGMSNVSYDFSELCPF